MRQCSTLISLSLLSLCFIFPQTLFAYDFSNNLKLGDTHADVSELQKVLNRDSDTLVASSGPGSMGNESVYFGLRTQAAVIKFQNKYASELLAPLSLSKGTGFVGSLTRKKLSEISTVSSVVSKITSTVATTTASLAPTAVASTKDTATSKSFFGTIFDAILQALPSSSQQSASTSLSIFSKDVRVYSVEPYQAKPGQIVTVHGVGFAPVGNIFSFGGTNSESTACSYSLTCDVVLPQGVSFGKESVSVRNQNGSSGTQQFSAYVYVTNTPVDAPHLTNINPNSITASSTSVQVKITGTNFESTGNYVYTPFGGNGPYASDGTTITFKLDSIKNIDAFMKRVIALKATNILLPVAVGNSYGMSNSISITVNFK